MRPHENEVSSALKILADSTRLRILAILDREELSVGELSGSLGMAQSRVSNHLRVLRDAGLLTERHSGSSTFLRRTKTTNGAVVAGRLWDALRGTLSKVPEHVADLDRLDAVLAKRRARAGDFFDRVAGEWDKIAGNFETGQGRHRAVTHLLPKETVVADLGCGTGYLAAAVLGQCSRVICVDRSEGMLKEARKRLERGSRNTVVEFRSGELDELPIEDGEVDGALVGMVMHHLVELDRPLAEMRRIIKPGGSAVALELAPHREAWMRQEQGDRHLGLDPSDLVASFNRAGFEEVVLDPLQDRYCPRAPGGEEAALDLYIVRGRVPR